MIIFPRSIYLYFLFLIPAEFWNALWLIRQYVNNLAKSSTLEEDFKFRNIRSVSKHIFIHLYYYNKVPDSE